MTGFAGCVSLDPGAWSPAGRSGPDYLADLAAAFAPEPGHAVETSCDASAGFVSVALGAFDGLAARDGVVVALAGEIADEGLSTDVALPERLVQRYLIDGAAALCDLNGMYAAAVWDGRVRELLLITDSRGFRPLFYWLDGRTIRFGTRYGPMASHPAFPRRIYPSAVLEMLRFGYLLGDDTLFEAVKLTPAGSVVRWSESGLSVRRYWDYAFQGDVTDMTQAADGLAEALRAAVKRRTPASCCVQLTGGLDSRAIAGFLHETAPACRAEAITIGMPTSLEIAYAARLAQDLGYGHRPFFIDDGYYARWAEEGVRRTEGLVINHTSWRLATDPWLAESGLSEVSNGFMSIFPRMSPAVEPLLSNPGRDATLAVTHRMMGDMEKEVPLDDVFLPGVYDAIRELPDRRIAETVDAAPTDRDVHRYDYAELRLRQRGFQAPNMNYFRPRARVFAPITDAGVVDFAGRMAPEVRNRSAAYLLMLQRHLPCSCRAPHIKDNMPLLAPAWERGLRKAWGRLYYKVLPRLTGGAVGTVDRMAYVPYRAALRQGSRAMIEADLSALDQFEGVLDPAAARALVREYLDGKRPGYGPAYTLHTLALWARLYGAG